MKYVIYSDIQGNYKALEKFFRVVDRMDTSTDTELICLGDIVDKGVSFDDNLCIEKIKNSGSIAVRGNHEDRVLRNHIESSRKINLENLDYIQNLPLEITLDNSNEKIYLTHAPSKKRIFEAYEAQEEFKNLPEFIDLCFFGHSHKYSIFSKNKVGQVREEKFGINDKFQLDAKNKYLINPGGIGLFYDLPQTYLLFDSEKQELELKWLNH